MLSLHIQIMCKIECDLLDPGRGGGRVTTNNYFNRNCFYLVV